jgi:hypothetical protein
MITIDCPICDGDATTDEAMSVLDCDGCGTTLETAPDPTAVLDAAA